MKLCLDIGNSHIHAGVFQEDQLLLQFRKATKTGSSSDEYGVFLRSVIRENGIDPQSINSIALCSVVPEVLYPINACLQKYFDADVFVLQAGVKTGLQIGYLNPLEVGADRIANAIAVMHLYPNKNVIIIDLGTATTFCAISASKKYLGGVIMPGMKMSMKALESGTSKLRAVEIIDKNHVLGRTTTDSIQSGLYFGGLGAMKEIIQGLKKELFADEEPLVIGTGGFTTVYRDAGVFTEVVPDLVLKGLFIASQMNKSS